LPDDLLIKADRMTMANSVELRVPFLDHQLLEFAATLPTNLRVSGLTTKYILKKALKGRVPKQILERKKAGFPVPYESWFDGDLKGWLHDLLLQQSTLERGYFRKAGLQELLNGNGVYEDRGKDLFSLAILELWHRAFLDKGGPSVSSETPAVLQAQ
jgi:asparagine synthase (glutamine-hydrolysing)